MPALLPRENIVQPQDESIRLIPLTQGQVAIVDAADYECLMQWTWFAYWGRLSKSFYAARNIRKNSSSPYKYRMIAMHNFILGVERGGDHVNCEATLDNRRRNLRVATQSQQCMNQAIRSDNKSGYKGVSWRSERGKWFSCIYKDKKRIDLGHFDCKIQAALAYDNAAKNIFGEFAHLNFPIKNTL